jgi:3-phenylpropionate/trans-cinnamate dioxygenase ferredoxin subunit
VTHGHARGLEETARFRTLDEAAKLPDDDVRPYYLEDLKRRVSTARVEGTLYAFDDLCTCADERCPLSSGLLRGTTLMCQCHGSQFDIRSGAVLRGPATQALATYETRVADGQIEVRA